MKKIISNLLLLLFTITAASQTMPAVRVEHGQRQKRLYVKDSRQSHKMHLAKYSGKTQSRHIQARCIRKEKVSEGVYKNLYQCSVNGVWNKNVSQYSPTWTTYVTFDENAGTATFSNLSGFDGGTYVTPTPVTAPMKDGVITIPCSNFDGSDGSTCLGDFWGTPVYLYAGDYDDASGTILYDEELKFTIGKDYSTLRTDDKAMAIVYTYNGELTSLTFVSKPIMDLANESASSSISTDSLDFGKTTPGGKTSATFLLTSTGTKDVNYSISIDNQAFQLSGDKQGIVSALHTKEFAIMFSPTSEGLQQGIATITTDEASYKIALSGNCVDVPSDFSPIFTKGDASVFTWDNTSDYPWSINEQSQAVPGNLGQRPVWDEEEAEKQGDAYNPTTESMLTASYNSTSAMRLSYDMYLDDDPADSLRMEIDGKLVYRYTSNTRRNYNYSCIIPKGKHTITWTFTTSLWAEDTAKVYIGNARLEEVGTWEGVVKSGNYKYTSYDMTNIAGKAYSKSNDGTLSAEVATTADNYISFEYEEGKTGIVLSTYNYDNDEYKEVNVDGSGKFGYTIPSGFNGIVTINVPKDEYIAEVRTGEGKYESVKRTYQMVGVSYYSQSGAFMTEGGYKFSYPCEVTFDTDGLVRFDGLFLPNDNYYPHHAVIKGRIAEDGKIHISSKKDFNEGTLYGWDDKTFTSEGYIGNRYWLVAGPVENNVAQPKDELVISMSDDKLLLTADDAFGVWVTFNYFTTSTSFEYWMPGTSFFAANDSYSLITDQQSLDFGSTYPNVKTTKSLLISNNGKDNNVSIKIEGAQKEAFTVSSVNGKVASLASFDCTVAFQAEKVGEYNAELKIYNDGETLTIPLHATVQPSYDYSAIVDEGAENIKWTVASNYPWTIDGNTAYSSNKGVMSSHSAIVASIDIPKGSVGTLSFQAQSYPEPGYDSFRFLDGDSIYFYSLQRNDSIVYQHILTEGHHDVTFDFCKDNIDEVYFVGDYASLSHIRLNIAPAKDDDARLFIPEASFTEIVPIGETYYGNAYIVNTGKNVLSVTSAESDGHFGAYITNPQYCEPGDTLHLYTTFTADRAGTYNEKLKFNTSAGILELPLQATADYVVYLSDKDSYNYGYPYPTAWIANEHSFVNVQCIYNEEMTEGLKGRDLLSMTFFSYILADAPLDCPDVTYQIGTVSKAAVYDEEASGLTTIYSGAQPQVINYELTIPFDKPYHFDGGHLETQLLLRAKDNFRVRFPFLSSNVGEEYPHCSGITDKGGLNTDEAILPYVRFLYAPTSSDILSTRNLEAKEVKSLRIYSASGCPQNKLQRGLNIIVTTFTDGTSRSTRQFIR